MVTPDLDHNLLNTLQPDCQLPDKSQIPQTRLAIIRRKRDKSNHRIDWTALFETSSQIGLAMFSLHLIVVSFQEQEWNLHPSCQVGSRQRLGVEKRLLLASPVRIRQLLAKEKCPDLGSVSPRPPLPWTMDTRPWSTVMMVTVPWAAVTLLLCPPTLIVTSSPSTTRYSHGY